MDAKTTGRFLAELRKEKGYTQKELGDKLMVTDKAISRWETGKGLPDTALLKPLSEILGVSVGELLAGKRVPPEQAQDETDSIVVEVVRHSRHTAARAAGFCLVIVGILLLLTPLVVTTQSKSGAWALGFAPIREQPGFPVITGEPFPYNIQAEKDTDFAGVETFHS